MSQSHISFLKMPNLQVPQAGNNNRVVTNIPPATPPVARQRLDPDQV